MLILGICIVLSAAIYAANQSRFHVRPRPAFCTVTIVGITEQSEQMQFTATLFEDEAEDCWNKKIQKIFLIREARLKVQNERMLEITKQVEEEQKKAQEEAQTAKTVADGVLKGIDGGLAT